MLAPAAKLVIVLDDTAPLAYGGGIFYAKKTIIKLFLYFFAYFVCNSLTFIYSEVLTKTKQRRKKNEKTNIRYLPKRLRNEGDQ